MASDKLVRELINSIVLAKKAQQDVDVDRLVKIIQEALAYSSATRAPASRGEPVHIKYGPKVHFGVNRKGRGGHFGIYGEGDPIHFYRDRIYIGKGPGGRTLRLTPEQIASVGELFEKRSQPRLQEFAPGIPAAKRKTKIPSLTRPKPWKFTLHEHEAERAGAHADLRLSDGDRAYSWALPKGELPQPGKVRLAVRQPDHTPEYMDFKGVIPEGYGKGRVKIRETGGVQITEAGPDKIKFVLTGRRDPEEFVLFRPKGNGEDNWLLLNRTPTRGSKKDVPSSKPSYKDAPTDSLTTFMGPDWVFQPKVDGAHATVDFTGDYPRIYSYRPSQRSERLINHTYRVGAEKHRPHEDLKGTLARGEVYGVNRETGQAIPANELGGILNATTDNALQKLEDQGVDLKMLLFDVIRHKGRDVANKPYREKMEILREINRKTPTKFEVPKNVSSPQAKLDLFELIKQKKYPLTAEGVIAWHKDAPGNQQPPMKLKIRPDRDVYVRDVFPGKGRLAGEGAGGLRYSLTPRGKVVGNIGTGFSDELRRDMYENPQKYKGRVAKVTSLGHYPSGALRAPAFVGWHLEKGKRP